MTPPARLSVGERQIVLGMVVVSAAIHAAAFFVFRVTDTVKIPPLTERPRVQWLRPPGLQQPAAMALSYTIAETFDPSLMSLPSARGFSRAVWERGIAAAHRPVEWTAPPAFLELNPPAEFPTLLEQPELAALVRASVAKQPATPETADAEPLEPALPINQTVLRISGGLEGRAVARAPQLPAANSTAPLRPTQIRVGVDEDGVVLYALLERSSGNEEVDATALQLVRQIRFEPSALPETKAGSPAAKTLSWGVVRFLWATQPPAAAAEQKPEAKP